MVEYVVEMHNDQLFLPSKLTVYLANYFSNLTEAHLLHLRKPLVVIKGW